MQRGGRVFDSWPFVSVTKLRFLGLFVICTYLYRPFSIPYILHQEEILLDQIIAAHMFVPSFSILSWDVDADKLDTNYIPHKNPEFVAHLFSQQPIKPTVCIFDHSN